MYESKSLIKQEVSLSFSKKYLINNREKLLGREILRLLQKFPRNFDENLQKGLNRLLANMPSKFCIERSLTHLRHLLLVQFFLQKKIEIFLKSGKKENSSLFLKVFSADSYRICIALIQFFPHDEDYFSFSQIIKESESLLPSLEKIEQSSYSWFEPEYGYRFCYFELQKTRGKNLTRQELNEIAMQFHQKLQSMSARPTIFFPYNVEEAYRQLILLKKEIACSQDFPQVSIQFQGKSSFYLEFLIHLVCPKKKFFLYESVKRLPSNVRITTHFQQSGRKSFLVESIVLSIQIPLGQFLENSTINLVHARRVVSRYIKDLVGPFRDYNGGLFEIQHQHFTDIKNAFSKQIPFFSFFAEKLFYSIKPIELQLSMSLEVVETLFCLFSQAFEYKHEIEVEKKEIFIVKLSQPSYELKTGENCANAYLEIQNFHYYCFIHKQKKTLSAISTKKKHVLRLNFLDGAPVSFNPWYMHNEIRCRFLSKTLYEGLTRIDLNGTPSLAGAESVQKSDDGLKYLFKIRHNHWSNGEKVTAYHYEQSWKQALIAKDVPGESYYILKNAYKIKQKAASIDQLGVKALDENTLHIELENSDCYFLEKLAQPLFSPLLSPLQVPKYFNGPYFLLIKNKSELVLEVNPYYWDRDNIFFIQIYIECEKTIAEVYNAYLDKAIDWIGSPFSWLPLEILNTLEKTDSLKKKNVARALWVYFNTSHLLFSSAVIRFAFNAVIDRSFIKNSIFPHDLLPTRLLPIEISSSPLKLETIDLDDVKSLFYEELKKLQFDEKKNSPIYFNHCSAPGYTEVALYLKQRWESIFNVPIILQGMPWNAFRSHLSRGNFDLAQCTESAFNCDPLELLQRFESKNSSYNYTNWSDIFFQKKIESIRNSLTSERQGLLQDAEEYLFRQLPFIPLLNRKFCYATSPNLIDYVINEIGDVDFRWAKFKE